MDLETATALLVSAEEDRRALRGRDADAAHARVEGRYPDLRAAFELFLDRGRAEEACRLTIALVQFWMASKRMPEGDDWLRRATALPGASEATRAMAVFQHGYLLFWGGDYERSAELSNRAVNLGRAANAPTVVSLSLGVLARIALNTDVEEAKRLLREAIAVTEGTDDVQGRSSAMHVLGVAYQMSGEFEAARAVMSDRIALGRQTDNEYLVAIESANLGMVERQLGNLERAEELSLEALAIVDRLQDAIMIPWLVNGLAAVTAARGDLDRAAVLNGFAEAGIEAAGGKWPPDERQQYEGTLATLRAGMTMAAMDRARARGATMSTPEGLAFALQPTPPRGTPA
ncbi:MAG: hypothetical protein EPO36_10170 [Chloroflexota bacterium]|nr:MAG: hypothetical protein EPO36_10170 [Chloroflexota bacterium]